MRCVLCVVVALVLAGCQSPEIVLKEAPTATVPAAWQLHATADGKVSIIAPVNCQDSRVPKDPAQRAQMAPLELQKLLQYEEEVKARDAEGGGKIRLFDTSYRPQFIETDTTRYVRGGDLGHNVSLDEARKLKRKEFAMPSTGEDKDEVSEVELPIGKAVCIDVTKRDQAGEPRSFVAYLVPSGKALYTLRIMQHGDGSNIRAIAGDVARSMRIKP